MSEQRDVVIRVASAPLGATLALKDIRPSLWPRPLSGSVSRLRRRRMSASVYSSTHPYRPKDMYISRLAAQRRLPHVPAADLNRNMCRGIQAIVSIAVHPARDTDAAHGAGS